jgi:hypothetical protein
MATIEYTIDDSAEVALNKSAELLESASEALEAGDTERSRELMLESHMVLARQLVTNSIRFR